MTSQQPRRRSAKAQALSKKTREACVAGAALVELLAGAALDEEGGRLLLQLREDLEVLGAAPTLRIRASRRVQGARSRRATASKMLFDTCAEVRRRVKLRYRGPRHAALRQAFGEGAPASPAKPETVLPFAQQVLDAAPEHTAELHEVRVGSPTIERIARLRQALVAVTPERADLRAAQRHVGHNLEQLAQRVEQTCAALRQHAGGAT